MVIRPFTHEEADLWLALRQKLWPALSREQLYAEQREILADPASNFVCLAELKTAGPIAFAEFSIRDWAEGCETRNVGYVEAWYVEPAHRGRGVGKALLAAGESWAAKHGASEMASDAELDNRVSQQAHERAGFREVLRLVLYAKVIKRETVA
jgi:aminoglycoside 6'-N-acetyltransferase I